MNYRKITNNNAISISRTLRGNEMRDNAVLALVPNGILFAPVDRVAEYEQQPHFIGRFDQFNRLRVPQWMLAAAKMGETVCIQLNDDDTLLVTKPLNPICCICGGQKHLRLLRHNKFLCITCQEAMREAQT